MTWTRVMHLLPSSSRLSLCHKYQTFKPCNSKQQGKRFAVFYLIYTYLLWQLNKTVLSLQNILAQMPLHLFFTNCTIAATMPFYRKTFGFRSTASKQPLTLTHLIEVPFFIVSQYPDNLPIFTVHITLESLNLPEPGKEGSQKLDLQLVSCVSFGGHLGANQQTLHQVLEQKVSLPLCATRLGRKKKRGGG